jgi:hypothetical protein
MSVVDPLQFLRDLVGVLKIPGLVRKVTVTAEIEEIVKVTVEHYLAADQGDSLTLMLTEYELVHKGTEPVEAPPGEPLTETA